MMPPKFIFAEGEKVLCFHGTLIYEAKCLKASITKEKHVKYFIHYAGWNKNWDEWVPESRVLKYNETNVLRQKQVQKAHMAQPSKSKKANSRKAESVKDSDSRASTPNQEVGEGVKNKQRSTPSSDQDSSSDVPRKERECLDSSVEYKAKSQKAESVKDTDSRASTPNQEVGKGVKNNQPSTPSSDQDSSSDVPRKERGRLDSSVKNKAKGRKAESVKDTDSRASTPNQEVGKGVKNKQPNTPSSGQDSRSDVPRKERGRLNPSVKSVEQISNKVEVKVKIPDELKRWLADDWDIITRKRKLAILPAKVCVDDILENYVTYKKSSKTHNANKEHILTEVTNGIRVYFNGLLGTQLLFTFERPQYAEISQKHGPTPLSKIYGSIHLLRLFVKLDSKLADTPMDEKNMQILLVYLHDFLKYLTNNRSALFTLQHYSNAPPGYCRKVQ